MSILITSLSSIFIGPTCLSYFLNGPLCATIATMILPIAVAAEETFNKEELINALLQAQRRKLAISLFLGVRGLASAIAGWRLNVKAEKPGWFALIPIASHAMRWFIVAGRYWWIFPLIFALYYAPSRGLLILFFLLIIAFGLVLFHFCEAKAYGAGPIMTILTIFLTTIARLIMAFHPDYTYQGPVLQGYISRFLHRDDGPTLYTETAPSANPANPTNPSDSDGGFAYPSFGTQSWNQDELAKTGAAANQTSYPSTNQYQPFTNSGLGFSNTSQGFANTNQSFSNTSQTFSNTSQSFSNPNQGLTSQSQGFTNASQGFANLGQAYANPGQGFTGSSPSSPSSPGVGSGNPWSQENRFSSSASMFPTSSPSRTSSGSSQGSFFPNATGSYPNFGGDVSSRAGGNPGGSLGPTPGVARGTISGAETMPGMGTMSGAGTIPGMGSMPNRGAMPSMGARPSMGTRPNMGTMPSTGVGPEAGSSPETGSDSFFQS